MSGHRPFSDLTKDWDEWRLAKVQGIKEDLEMSMSSDVREVAAKAAYRHEPNYDGFGTCHCGAVWTPTHLADAVLAALDAEGIVLCRDYAGWMNPDGLIISAGQYSEEQMRSFEAAGQPVYVPVERK